MTDLIDPETWQANSNPNDPDTPSFTFSVYFQETSNNVIPKIAGAWLRFIDRDTINMLFETLQYLDKTANIDEAGSSLQSRKDMADLLYLTQLIWQWETDKAWICDPSDVDKVHLHVEYFWRLASLIHYEYLQRNCSKSKDGMLEEDNAKHNGKLTILEKTSERNFS